MAFARVKDIAEVMDRWCPPEWAESWDNVGLLVGDPAAEVKRVLVTLDVTPAAAFEAAQKGAQMIVSHHPLIFKPLKSLRADRAGQGIAWRLARDGIAAFAAHTNLDVAPGGVNDALAAALELQDCKILEENAAQMFKLTVFIPKGYEERVQQAVFAAGAGRYGHYDQCGFAVEGQGGFRPLAGSSPFLGATGRHTLAQETRFEAILDAADSAAVVAALLKAHPYETPAFDLAPVKIPKAQGGLGRIGSLPRAMNGEELGRYVCKKLSAQGVRLCGTQKERISRVAVCGGSGAGTIDSACALGADALVTGDVDHHEALYALERGLLLLDAGHGVTERVVLDCVVDRLQTVANALQWNLDIVKSDESHDPWMWVQG